MSTQYNTKNIRHLLIEGFDDAELRAICYDHFRPVYDELALNTGKKEIVQQIIEYVEQQSLLELLLSLVKEKNPAKYSQFEPYYNETIPLSEMVRQPKRIVFWIIIPVILGLLVVIVWFLLSSNGQSELTPTPVQLPMSLPKDLSIAFASDREGDWDIYVTHLNDDYTIAEPNNLTGPNNGLKDKDPTWSPDGEKIAFARGEDEKREICVIYLDKNRIDLIDLQCLTKNERIDDYEPAWSPDGQKIAFVSTREGGDEDIYVMDAEKGERAGGQAIPLT
jgi:hypothetical protein